MEQQGINPLGIGLVAAALAYLFVKPGVLPGAIDYYITAPLQRMKAKAYSKVRPPLGWHVPCGGH
jgi:hypothetical protein